MEFTIPERWKLRAIGAFRFTYFPKALVEFDVQGGIRPRWGLTDQSHAKVQNPGS